MSNLSIIIIGAGKGTRMKSKISKLLHKIGNLEMINHVIGTAKLLDPEEICVVCSEENIEEIKKNVDNSIILTIQKDRLGTAHAVQTGFEAISKKQNNILIMYGDVPLITLETYKKIVNTLETSKGNIVNLGFNTKDISNKYGRFIVDGDNLKQIVEFKDASEEIKNITLCNSGILIVNGNDLKTLLPQVKNNNNSKEYYITDIIGIANKENKICKYIIGTEDEVMGVNSKYELSIAEKIFQNKKRMEFMNNGVTLIDPESIYFSYDTIIGNDVVIEPNVYFLPKVKIGDNVTIHSFSYLENCTIETNASIGPFARIRPNTIIKQNAHIGNFVEIKKSTIGENTKIGHLTYIGDCTIGKDTNIGAGCITCNYDGFSKFQSEIGDNCFVGSSTIMISPVKLKNNCVIGAGSIITKDVEENDLAIARSEQQNFSKKAINYRLKRQKK